MRIYIDIGHPAHVHYFRNFIKLMGKKGHSFFITARQRYPVHELLDHYQIAFVNRGKGKDSTIGKIVYMLQNDLLLLKLSRKFKPDMFLSFSSPYTAQVSSLLHKPSIAIDDTENATFGRLFYKPFTNHIISPSTFNKDLGIKHIKINSYLELCYLLPKYFSPDKSVYSFLGITPSDPYVIIRFVSWTANHDRGHLGISMDNKAKAVKEFSKYAKVFISSEEKLPEILKSYQIAIPPEKMHDAIAFSSLVYGESATMASEAAVLGVPAIYIDNIGRGYTTEEENKYHLVFNFTESTSDQERSILKGIELLQDPNIKKTCQKNRKKIIDEKINVTAFLVWFIENYPYSASTMIKTPDYQYNFK